MVHRRLIAGYARVCRQVVVNRHIEGTSSWIADSFRRSAVSSIASIRILL